MSTRLRFARTTRPVTIALAFVAALTVTAACGDDDGGGVDAGPRIDSGVITEPVVDAGPADAAATGVLGMWCGDATDAGPITCAGDLVCCLPCGAGGCLPVCTEPCSQDDPGCDLGSGCVLFP